MPRRSDTGHLYLSEAPERPVVMAGGRPLLEGMRIEPRPASAAVSQAGEGAP